MIGFVPVEPTLEKISQTMNSEIEVLDETAIIRKQRSAKLQRENRHFIVALDMELSFSFMQDSISAINKAEISLLPEEFLPFSSALRKHHLSFPTNYSQRLVQEAGNCIVHLESLEPPEHFTERFAYALRSIKG